MQITERFRINIAYSPLILRLKTPAMLLLSTNSILLHTFASNPDVVAPIPSIQRRLALTARAKYRSINIFSTSFRCNNNMKCLHQQIVLGSLKPVWASEAAIRPKDRSFSLQLCIQYVLVSTFLGKHVAIDFLEAGVSSFTFVILRITISGVRMAPESRSSNLPAPRKRLLNYFWPSPKVKILIQYT